MLVPASPHGSFYIFVESDGVMVIGNETTRRDAVGKQPAEKARRCYSSRAIALRSAIGVANNLVMNDFH